MRNVMIKITTTLEMDVITIARSIQVIIAMIQSFQSLILNLFVQNVEMG